MSPLLSLLACFSRYKDFQESREALLKGDVLRAQEAAGRMSTDPDGLVSSFEYAGELQLEFGGGAPQNDGLRAPPVNGEETVVEEYIRHLHLNNATGKDGAKGEPAAPGDVLVLSPSLRSCYVNVGASPSSLLPRTLPKFVVKFPVSTNYDV